MTKDSKKCIYCSKNKKGDHFCCDVCGVGMCDDCYNTDCEHDEIYHEICESATAETYALIVESVGHEPAYLCNACLNKILKDN